MAKIHVTGDGHTPPAAGSFQYLPYTDAKKKKVVQDALDILTRNVKGSTTCNRCFQNLTGGRTFDAILNDPDVFLHYDPGTATGRFGATRGTTKNVTITEFSISQGKWTVAATIVHEFAHVNGASGSTHDAEATLPKCGFGALYDPTIIGLVPSEEEHDTRIV